MKTKYIHFKDSQNNYLNMINSRGNKQFTDEAGTLFFRFPVAEEAMMIRVMNFAFDGGCSMVSIGYVSKLNWGGESIVPLYHDRVNLDQMITYYPAGICTQPLTESCLVINVDGPCWVYVEVLVED